MKLIGKHKSTLWHPQGMHVEHELYNRDLWIMVANIKLITTTDTLLYQLFSNEPAADHPAASVFNLRSQCLPKIFPSARNACK